MITPDPKRDRLQAAYDYVCTQKGAGASAEMIIAGLVANHRAAHRPRWDTNRLNCARVSSTCSASAGATLLDNWTKTAGLRLIGAAMGGFGHE